MDTLNFTRKETMFQKCYKKIIQTDAKLCKMLAESKANLSNCLLCTQAATND